MNQTAPAPLITEQQLYDAIVRHAGSMPRKAVERGFCRFLTPDGNKCFVGCLLTDEEATNLDTRQGQSEITDWGFLPDRLYPHAEFLGEIQNIHDSCEQKTWPNHLISFAITHNLDTTVLKETFS